MGSLVGLFLTLLASGVGYFIYTQSNQIVSINKDIEYMKDYDIECKNDINELEKDVIENTTNIKLIQQKLDSSKENSNKSRK